MKNLALIIIALASTSVFADSAIVWTCIGSDVKITARQPYLGDGPGRAYAQTLYTVTEKVLGNFDESMATAFFLSVSDKEVSKGENGIESAIINGTNGKKGTFSLAVSDIVQDTTVPGFRYTGKGTLNFSHGYLNNKNVAVDCVKE